VPGFCAVRVLLTGATGFVGARVAEALVDGGDHVVAVVRAGSDAERLSALRGLRLVEGELLREGGMAEAVRVAPDVCIHCAWYTEPGKYLSSPDNVGLAHGTARFAAALAEAGCRRFVGVGTCFEYDTEAGYLSEKTRLAPAHVYSAAKVATYLLVRELTAGTAMSFAWARLFYLYGPHEHPNRLVPSVIGALLRGEEARVTPGGQVRDFLHVDDAAAALCAIARSEVTDAVNVGSGEPVTVATLVTKIGALLGREDLLRLGAREYSPGDPMFVCADNRKLRAIGWARKYTLDDGLAHTIRTGHQQGAPNAVQP